MKVDEFLLLLSVLLKDEVEGTVESHENEITVRFENGVERTISVK